MAKKHNLLQYLLNNKGKHFSIREIAKNTDIDYKTAYTEIQKLIQSNNIQAMKVGQTTLCTLNLKAFNIDVFTSEVLRREMVLKRKDFSTLITYFHEIVSPFFILLLFGSYASGKQTKYSDIDLMLITDDKATLKKVKNKISLIPLNIQLTSFPPNEFLAMLKTTEFNVGKEALNNNILLCGIEDYYRLLQRA